MPGIISTGKNYIFILIKVFLFCLSNIGYWEFLRRKTKVNINFLPILTIALQSVIVFLSGLLNTLKKVRSFYTGPVSPSSFSMYLRAK